LNIESSALNRQQLIRAIRNQSDSET
jgi:hypothetical protein